MADSTLSTPKKARNNRIKAQRAMFIDALRNSANVRAAAQAAGIDRKTAYNWRERNKAFAGQWDEALADACDTLEAAAWVRARDGVTKPIYQQGERVGEVQEYSDTLLIFLLKAHRPAVYRETINSRVMTWQDELIAALRDGSLSAEEVTRELGDAIGGPIITAAGLATRRATRREGQQDTSGVEG